MKTVFCLFLTVILVSPADAQRIRGIAGYAKIGYSEAPGSANTFRKIAPDNITGYTNHYLLFGAEGYFRSGKAIIGLDGSLGAQGDYSSDTRHTEPFIGAGHVKFGWIISENDRYWVYPSFGTGTSVTILSSYRRIEGKSRNVDNQMLASPSFDIGLNADFIVSPVPAEKKRYGAFLIGLRTGFRASFSNNNWRDEDWDRLDNPSYANNAFYITLSVGGGFFYKKEVQR